MLGVVLFFYCSVDGVGERFPRLCLDVVTCKQHCVGGECQHEFIHCQSLAEKLTHELSVEEE